MQSFRIVYFLLFATCFLYYLKMLNCFLAANQSKILVWGWSSFACCKPHQALALCICEHQGRFSLDKAGRECIHNTFLMKNNEQYKKKILGNIRSKCVILKQYCPKITVEFQTVSSLELTAFSMFSDILKSATWRWGGPTCSCDVFVTDTQVT